MFASFHHNNNNNININYSLQNEFDIISSLFWRQQFVKTEIYL